MNPTPLKKGLAILLAATVLSGCSLNLDNLFGKNTTTPPTPDTADQTPPAFDPTKEMTTIAPYYANGDIEYLPKPTALSTDALVGDLKEQIMKAYTEGFGGNTVTWAEVSKSIRFYEVGKIKSKNYQNKTLVTLQTECEGMCVTTDIYRFVYDKGKNELTFLTRHSSSYISSLAEATIGREDQVTFFKGVDPPEKIKIPNNDLEMELKEIYSAFMPDGFDKATYEFSFADESAGNLYEHKGDSFGCMYLTSPDGTISLYAYDPHFFNSAPVEITWTDGSPATPNLEEKYAYLSGGCGIRLGCYLLQQNVKQDELKLAGKTSSGIELYVAKTPDEKAQMPKDGKESAQQKLAQAYNDYKSGYQYNENADKEPLMDFNTFAARNPILYWQDPLKRWSALIDMEIMPPGECGKPVIYLYPEKTTDVNVKVGIEELTKTIPDYGENGWTVNASPDGTLYNYADKGTYPYLFWEGNKKDGLPVTKGFLVERENLTEFLDESLTELGLTKNEKSDFTDFWLTRMLDNKEPYFFISFMGTKDFNKVAPLDITPTPDTLIRVFMYYMPTYDKITMPEQELKSLERNGFTVVEWGGTSSKQWRD